MPRFPGSTHQRNWIFQQTKLQDLKRQKMQKYQQNILDFIGQQYLQYLMQQNQQDGLIKLLAIQLLTAAKHLKMSPQAQATALSYFKRFFLKFTTSQFQPLNIMFTCLFLACKTQQINIKTAQNFSSNFKQSNPRQILKYQPIVLSGIDFQLYVFSPDRPLDFLISSIQIPINRQECQSFINWTLISDLSFTQSPSLLALAAIWHNLAQNSQKNQILFKILQQNNIQLNLQRLPSIVQTALQTKNFIQNNQGSLSGLMKKSSGVRNRVKKIVSRRKKVN